MIPWKEHTAPDGRKYYYNKESKESRWVMPEEMKKAAAANGGGGAKDGAGPAAAGWAGGILPGGQDKVEYGGRAGPAAAGLAWCLTRDREGRGRSPADTLLLDICAQSSHPRTVCTSPPLSLLPHDSFIRSQA